MSLRDVYDWLGEAAVVVLTVIVTLGLERLFVDTSYLRDALVIGLASHVVSIAARRAGLGMAAAGLLSAASAVVTLTALLYPDTANLVLPTGDTLDLLRADLSEGWETFSEESAPVPVVPGFVAALGALLWICAFLADWAAFRLRSPVEAIAPAGAIFAFTALLGAESDRVLHATLFAAAVAAVLLTMRVNRQSREEVWIEPSTGQGPGATLRLGLLAGTGAVVVGAVFGPLVPGAGDPPIVDVTELDDGPQTRVVVSPLVEVQATIVDQAQFEIFRVDVDREDRDYWRLMSLDEFDGDLWKASSNFDPADGPVPTALDPSVQTRPVVQTYTTTALESIWLPIARELSAVIDDGGLDLEYEVESATMVVTRGSQAASRDGFSYTVESAVPVLDNTRLQQASTDQLESSFLGRYTQLPDDLPATILSEAQRVADGSTSDFGRARALQDYFHENFTYNINVALEQDVDDLESFMFEAREGYCVQFASAYAAMARAVGLPTRIAVGFTWGEWDEEAEAYIVRGEHAHAWPEVYFAGTGWVRFEPTPGRGGPNDQAVTGLQPLQAGNEEAVPTTTVSANAPSATLPFRDPDLALPTDAGSGSAASDEATGVPLALVVAAITAGALALVVGAVPTVRALIRRRRAARAAHDPRARIELAWLEALEALELVELRHRPQETPTEFAHRVHSRHRGGLGRITGLAESTTTARYSAELPDAEVADAESCAREIRTVCRRSTSPTRRALAMFDPRTLVRR